MGWVLPNLELSHKKDNITKESNPIPKELGFLFYVPVAQMAEASVLNTVKVSVQIRWGIQKIGRVV